MLLALVVWIGGIIFLAFVEAPTVFSPGLLPTRHMAGSIVGRTLDVLHWMGIISGIVFLIASMAYCRMTAGRARPLALRHLLIVLMLLLTSDLAVRHLAQDARAAETGGGHRQSRAE